MFEIYFWTMWFVFVVLIATEIICKPPFWWIETYQLTGDRPTERFYWPLLTQILISPLYHYLFMVKRKCRNFNNDNCPVYAQSRMRAKGGPVLKCNKKGRGEYCPYQNHISDNRKHNASQKKKSPLQRFIRWATTGWEDLYILDYHHSFVPKSGGVQWAFTVPNSRWMPPSRCPRA